MDTNDDLAALERNGLDLMRNGNAGFKFDINQYDSSFEKSFVETLQRMNQLAVSVFEDIFIGFVEFLLLRKRTQLEYGVVRYRLLRSVLLQTLHFKRYGTRLCASREAQKKAQDARKNGVEDVLSHRCLPVTSKCWELRDVLHRCKEGFDAQHAFLQSYL
jgi:hypothetical protein